MSNTLTLWEDTDLTEQWKKSESKPIFALSDGINETSNVSVKSECCDTGSKSKWMKKCPKCNLEIFYDSAREYEKAIECNLKCSRCSRNLKSQAQFRHDCKLVHGNKYNYSGAIYINTRTPVGIICSKHGKFSQTPENHLSGQGCPFCGNSIKLDAPTFIILANRLHLNKYDYSKVKYVNNKTKILINCSEHGDFLQTPNSHLRGRGCPICGYVKVSVALSSNLIDFVLKAKDIHNNRYDYSKFIYKNNRTKGIIICSIHGDFDQCPDTHFRGQGCPKCNCSKGELKIARFLENNNIKYIYQHWFKDCRSDISKRQVLKFDYYVPNRNLLIEFDGEQHFRYGCKLGKYVTTELDLKRTKLRDNIKNEYATAKGIKLVRIKYTQICVIDKILETNLL